MRVGRAAGIYGQINIYIGSGAIAACGLIHVAACRTRRKITSSWALWHDLRVPGRRRLALFPPWSGFNLSEWSLAAFGLV